MKDQQSSSVWRLALKYLNITFGLLMLVVFSLQLEQIFHNEHMTGVGVATGESAAPQTANQSSVGSAADELLKSCGVCQASSFHTMSYLNSMICRPHRIN